MLQIISSSSDECEILSAFSCTELSLLPPNRVAVPLFILQINISTTRQKNKDLSQFYTQTLWYISRVDNEHWYKSEEGNYLLGRCR
jgi:hypothetical protein